MQEDGLGVEGTRAGERQVEAVLGVPEQPRAAAEDDRVDDDTVVVEQVEAGEGGREVRAAGQPALSSVREATTFGVRRQKGANFRV
jgi:hypothetical protein